MFTEEVYHLFDGVTEEVSRNVRRLMVELWLNWSHVGIEYEDKVRNINQLVEIEENLHRDLLDETKRQVKTMKKKVEELKEEGKKLCKNLSIDISIIEHKEDMMLFEYKKELEKQIMRFTQQIEQRQIEMNRLLEWQHDLTEKLGVTFNELQDNRLPPQDELDKLRNHLAGLQSKRDERCKIFLRTQIEIKKIMDELQMRPQSEFEQVVFSSRSVDFKSTDLNMDRLAMLQQDLQEKYHQTNKRVLKLRQHLEGLWDCLDKDQTYRENFLKAHPGCHAATEAAIEEEIKRCETIQVLVTNVRTEIKLMWDNVMFSSAQREEFAYYHQDVFTAETLQIHKMYLDTITEYYNEHKPIFELVATRRKLWLKQAALDARVAEPGRLHNRGGNLLREEKQRKAIEVNLPKIETQIREIVTEYEAKSGKTFIVDGVPLLQLIEDEKESRIAERRNKLSARKRARAQAQAQTGAAASRAPSPRAPAPRAPSSPRAASPPAPSPPARRGRTADRHRRVSGRLATKALVAKAEGAGAAGSANRNLEYGADAPKTPKVSASILRHKRSSVGPRRRPAAPGRAAAGASNRNPLDTTSYADFKKGIDERSEGHSSILQRLPNRIPVILCDAFEETQNYSQINSAPMSPKTGTKNKRGAVAAPDLVCTPTRLTRSALELRTSDSPAASRAPPRYHSTNNLARKNTPTE